MRDNIIDLGDAATYAKSEDELIRMVSDFIDNPRDVPECLDDSVSRVLEYWVGNPDSAAGARVHQAILDVLTPKPARVN